MHLIFRKRENSYYLRKSSIYKDLGVKAPFIDCSCDALTVGSNVVWHLQRCWSLACTCCSAVGPLPSGRRFSGNIKRAKRLSVINSHIRAAQNTTGLSAAIFLTHGPTGWELHNKSVKLLMLIFNCCCVCVCVALRMQHVWYVTSQTQQDREWLVLQRVTSITFMAPSSVPWAAFWKKSIISSLVLAWMWLALFFAIKNELFLAHCVKTWASHAVHVCAHWNNFPFPRRLEWSLQLHVLKLYLLCFTLHADLITQRCAAAVRPPGLNGSELYQSLSLLSSLSLFILSLL